MQKKFQKNKIKGRVVNYFSIWRGLLLVPFLALIFGCQSTRHSTNELKTNELKKNLISYRSLLSPSTNVSLGNLIADNNINQLTQKMVSGELTSVQMVEYFLTEIDNKNPELHAVITINPNALAIARKLDQERVQGTSRGVLHGIPVIVKDNIETKDMPTTAGSLALKDNFTNRDATIIQKLSNAGAIILAKANLSEWANFRSERSSSGWSAIGGQSRNPHDLNRSTCGSSSGSGASVAANLAVFAIGTETDGSIICPASANGVVGIKPTVGLVSRQGIVPISHSQDTAGPMTKSVIDAAIVLGVIQGVDLLDKKTLSINSDPEINYLPEFADNYLNNKRIGVVYSGALDHEAVSLMFARLKTKLTNNGAKVIENLSLEPYENFGQDSYDVLLYEFKSDLNQYFSQLPNQFSELTLEKLIEFNRSQQEQEMPFFRQEIFEKSQKKGTLKDETYVNALSKLQQATRIDGIDKLLKNHKLDAIISVTLSPAWSIDRINGDHFTGGFSSYPAISGYPHITMPMGKVNHLPVGLSITGTALSEKSLINLAFAIELMLNE